MGPGSWLHAGIEIPRGLMAAVGAAVGAWLLLRWWRRAVRNMLLRNLPRLQERRFVHLLRDDAFADPTGVVATLSGNNASMYLRRLWTRAKDEVVRVTADAARADLANRQRLEPLTTTRWPSQPLVAKRVAAPGWALAVVTLPEAQRDGETYFVAVAVPLRILERGEAAPARRAVRFFVLNKWGLGRDTDFVEYVPGGRELTYNVGTGKTVEAFAAAVREKLRTPLPHWARAAQGAPVGA